jgi:hypothetical protein
MQCKVCGEPLSECFRPYVYDKSRRYCCKEHRDAGETAISRLYMQAFTTLEELQQSDEGAELWVRSY